MMTLIRKFMEIKDYSADHVEQIEVILDFLVARAKGEVPTGAKFIREYVLNHPLYKKDSKVSTCLQCCLIDQIINLNKEGPTNVCKCALTRSNSHENCGSEQIK